MKINIKNILRNKSVKLNLKEKIDFLEQLSNLLSSGIPIINSFTIMNYQTKNKRVKFLIEDTLNKLNVWKNLKEIFAWYKSTFNTFDISIIEMWEVTWELAESIEIIKNKEDKTRELKWKILWALVYPIVIIALSVAMIFVFMIYVIPKIKDMYSDAKVNLPSLTTNVIKISEFIQNNLNIIILLLVLFVVIIKTFKSHSYTKIYWDRWVLHIPLFGNLIKKKTLALFTNSLWMLLSRWVIINKALEISSRALENDYYEKKLKEIVSWVSKWENLSSLMWINEIKTGKANFYFPIELSSIVKIWEQTWRLPELLEKVGVKFNKEIDNITRNLSTAIEPIVIILVWLIVWTLIMAIMLPFFNMVNVI
jgi:type IV pilus assembly protein PilC